MSIVRHIVDPATGLAIFVTPDNPSTVGLDAYPGSMANTAGTGVYYIKFGTAITDWAQVALTSGFLPLSGGSLNAGANLTVPGALSVGGTTTLAAVTATTLTATGAGDFSGSTGFAVGAVAARRRISTSGPSAFNIIGDDNGFADLSVRAVSISGVLALPAGFYHTIAGNKFAFGVAGDYNALAAGATNGLRIVNQADTLVIAQFFNGGGFTVYGGTTTVQALTAIGKLTAGNTSVGGVQSHDFVSGTVTARISADGTGGVVYFGSVGLHTVIFNYNSAEVLRFTNTAITVATGVTTAARALTAAGLISANLGLQVAGGSLAMSGQNIVPTSDNTCSVGTSATRFADVRSVLGTFNSFTVSTGTTAVQAFTATTGNFSGATIVGGTLGVTGKLTAGNSGAVGLQSHDFVSGGVIARLSVDGTAGALYFGSIGGAVVVFNYNSAEVFRLTATGLNVATAITLPAGVYHTIAGNKFMYAVASDLNVIMCGPNKLRIINQADTVSIAEFFNGGGFTVYGGTTTVQAFVATTGVFNSNVTVATGYVRANQFIDNSTGFNLVPSVVSASSPSGTAADGTLWIIP